MNFSLYLGVLFALVCAFVTNLAFLFKHRGAAAAPPVDIRHPFASVVGLFRSRWFTIGWLVAAGAYIFHVLALALAPISVVQVALASGLVMLAVTADRLFDFTVGRRQLAGLFAMAVGLGLILATEPAVHGSHSSYSVIAMVAFEGVLLGIGALLIAGPRIVGAGAKQRGFALAAAQRTIHIYRPRCSKALEVSLMAYCSVTTTTRIETTTELAARPVSEHPLAHGASRFFVEADRWR